MSVTTRVQAGQRGADDLAIASDHHGLHVAGRGRQGAIQDARGDFRAVGADVVVGHPLAVGGEFRHDGARLDCGAGLGDRNLIARTEAVCLFEDEFLDFRNVVFDGTNQASLIDFDHVTIGPREWDIANMIMVCQIAERTDLIEGIYTFISDWSKPELLTYFLRIRYAQTLVHAAAHIDFETVAGFERRIKLIHSLLALKTSERL